MINLTPDEVKKNTVYAKRNTRLIRYVLVSALTMFLILAITGFSIFDMTRTQKSLNSQLETQTVKIESFKEIEKQGQALFDQVSTIKELLKRQVKFSEMFPNFAKILPSGSIILALDFNANDFTGEVAAGQKPTTAEDKPFVIRAATVDSQTATTLLENIKARTDLFVGADLIDIVKVEPSTGGENLVSQRYPYQVTINAYLKQDNQKTSSGQSLQETPIIPTPADRNSEKAQ